MIPPMHTLLAEMRQLDWSAFDVASHNPAAAANLPDAFARLFSPDPAVRETAYWQIDNEAVCQGDLYPAARPLAAFVLSALALRPLFGQRELFNVLYELTAGEAADPSVGREHRQIVRDAKGVWSYGLNSHDPDVRKTAADLVGVLEVKGV